MRRSLYLSFTNMHWDTLMFLNKIVMKVDLKTIVLGFLDLCKCVSLNPKCNFRKYASVVGFLFLLFKVVCSIRENIDQALGLHVHIGFICFS